MGTENGVAAVHGTVCLGYAVVLHFGAQSSANWMKCMLNVAEREQLQLSGGRSLQPPQWRNGSFLLECFVVPQHLALRRAGAKPSKHHHKYYTSYETWALVPCSLMSRNNCTSNLAGVADPKLPQTGRVCSHWSQGIAVCCFSLVPQAQCLQQL